MEDHRDNLVVIAAGYEKEMNQLLKANPGFSSRFTNVIQFDDYSADELFQIFERFSEKENYKLVDDAKAKLKNLINDIITTKLEHFGNGRVIRNIYRETVMNFASRLATVENKTKDQLINILEQDIPYRKHLNYLLKGQYQRLDYPAAMAEINSMIGLEKVKFEINNFVTRCPQTLIPLGYIADDSY